MPRYHIAMTNAKDFDETERLAAEGLGPRYAVPPMVRRLGATLYQANRDAPAPLLGDRLRSRLVGSPKSWSLARTLAARLGSDDVVYCLDADMGLPLAGASGGRPAGRNMPSSCTTSTGPAAASQRS